jgi:hypothetical protein
MVWMIFQDLEMPTLVSLSRRIDTNLHDLLGMLDDLPFSSSIDTFEITLVYHSRASVVIHS